MIQFHAKTYKGLENLLAEELVQIGATEVTVVNRGVDFKGSIAMMYKANLYLRTALRILMPIAKFKALDEHMLYKKIQGIDWSEFMTYKNSFVIDAVTFSSVFRNNHYMEQKIKDAIVDQFRSKTSLRPSVNVKNAEIRINVHVNQTFFTVSLDSSGESLHKRGYRKEMHPASLSEVLAAGIVLLTGWKGNTPLLNPMCGSGTIAIEAAMIAANIYPGITGREYSFQYWPDFDELLYGRLLEGMPEPVELKFPIVASDNDREAIRITRANIRGVGLDNEIVTKNMDFLDSTDIAEPSTLIMNPPYGERLQVDNINELYSGIGTSLKHKYPGSEAWIFSANFGALKFIGLKPDKKLVLFNAGLECKYQKYSLFSGTRKTYIGNSI